MEREREYLLANRVHDEFWFAEHFHLSWPVRPRTPDLSSQTNFQPLAGTSRLPAEASSLPAAATADDKLTLDDGFERYLDHYRQPRNREILPQAQAVGSVEWAGGAMLTFYLQLMPDKAGTLLIHRAGFSSQRCGIAVAYASLLSELIRGRPVEQAWRIGPVDLMQHFGSSLNCAPRT